MDGFAEWTFEGSFEAGTGAGAVFPDGYFSQEGVAGRDSRS